MLAHCGIVDGHHADLKTIHESARPLAVVASNHSPVWTPELACLRSAVGPSRDVAISMDPRPRGFPSLVECLLASSLSAVEGTRHAIWIAMNLNSEALHCLLKVVP